MKMDVHIMLSQGKNSFDQFILNVYVRNIISKQQLMSNDV